MMRRMRLLLAAFPTLVAFLTVTACNMDTQAAITIAVYPGAERCTIGDQPLPCATAGTHLREQLKIPLKRQIDVSMFQMDKSHDEKDIQRVATIVREAGYTDVRVWNFSL